VVGVYPKRGDNIDGLKTYKMYDGLYLAKRDDGSCLYLEDGQCSIYDRRPATCSGFDCRSWALREVKKGNPTADQILAVGRVKLGHLKSSIARRFNRALAANR